MNKLKMHSPDMTQAKIDEVARLFPNCLVEAHDADGVVKRSIDFDQLRQELSTSIVEGPQERYQLNWPGKREALLTANTPIAKTLRPCREESVDFDTTKNLFIEGDNLDALKLLQETYLNKVKLIYIDPPYNTGNDFIYADDFEENSEIYSERSNQKDEVGNRMVANTESNGRFHSVWMSMIYSRLKLARNLLRDDGTIFISIGEEEITNIERITSEIFGSQNKISIVARVAKTASNKGTHFAPSIDFIVCFAKDITQLPNFKDKVDIDLYKKVETDGLRQGDFYRDDIALYQSALDPMRGCSNQRYYIEAPDKTLLLPPGNNFPPNQIDASRVPPESKEDKVWRWSFSTYLERKNLLVFKSTTRSPLLDAFGNQAKWNIYTKSYLSDRQEDGTLPRNILTDFINRKGADLLKKYDLIFDYSKPVELVEYLLDITTTKNNDIVLDFFAGSCTTAHAVIKRNFEYGHSIKYICVQLPEVIQDGTSNVAEIGKERIRRVGKKLKQDNVKKTDIDQLDVGFRVLKIDSSNMKEVFYTPDAVSQDLLSDQVNNIREDRTSEDLLFQVLLDWGVDLALPITQETISGKTVYFVDGNALAACFDTGVSEEFVKLLAKRAPLRAVFRDAGFASDSVKINVEQIFKLMSPGTEVKTI